MAKTKYQTIELTKEQQERLEQEFQIELTKEQQERLEQEFQKKN